MMRSSNKGLGCISVCPYQYVRGINALEDQTVGADEADSPKGHADVEVDRGVDREVAEMLPGTDHAPYKMKDPSDTTQGGCTKITNITWIHVNENWGPLVVPPGFPAYGVVNERFTQRGFAGILRADNKYMRRGRWDILGIQSIQRCAFCRR